MVRNFYTKKKRIRKKMLKSLNQRSQAFEVRLEEVQHLTIGSVRKMIQKMEEQAEKIRRSSKKMKKEKEAEWLKRMLKTYINELQRRETLRVKEAECSFSEESILEEAGG